MTRTFVRAALVASGLVLGTSGFAFAQQGLGNVPASGDELNQPYADAGRSSTNGYSERSDRDVPAGWRSQRQQPSAPLLPRH